MLTSAPSSLPNFSPLRVDLRHLRPFECRAPSSGTLLARRSHLFFLSKALDISPTTAAHRNTQLTAPAYTIPPFLIPLSHASPKPSV